MSRKPINVFQCSVARLLLSVFLFCSCSSNSTPSPKPPPPQNPEESSLRGESSAILDNYDALIRSDPGNGQLRVARCSFLGERIPEVARGERERIRARALADCEYVLKTATDPRLVAHANDVARVIQGREVFSETKTICPEEARKAAQEAYFLFRANKLKESVPHSERAVARCPENAMFQIRLGHTFMLLRDFDRAKKSFTEGLRRDPWDRSGHLFLSDLYRQGGDLDQAYKSASLAVVGDPSYEFGWQQLKELAVARGKQWRRPINQRAVVRPDAKGNPEAVLPLGADLDSPETEFWLSLGLAEVTELKQAAQATAGTQGRQSPLDQDRRRVKETLDFHRQLVAKDPARRSQMTDILEEAAKKGSLDEAIFLCLIDARLAPEYIAYREKHRERLLEFISSALAPAARNAPAR
jgi:tetratricopeptide (TPR) repeat protein